MCLSGGIQAARSCLCFDLSGQKEERTERFRGKLRDFCLIAPRLGSRIWELRFASSASASAPAGRLLVQRRNLRFALANV